MRARLGARARRASPGNRAQRIGGDGVELEAMSLERSRAVLVGLGHQHGERRRCRRSPRHPPRRPPAAIAARCDPHDPLIAVVTGVAELSIEARHRRTAVPRHRSRSLHARRAPRTASPCRGASHGGSRTTSGHRARVVRRASAIAASWERWALRSVLAPDRRVLPGATGPRAPRLPVSLFRRATTRRRADPLRLRTCPCCP